MRDIKARSSVVIMVVIAVFAVILRIAAEQVLKINIAQNESVALTTLKLISAALENYAKDNNDIFPSRFSVLTQTTPHYLDKDYISDSPIRGYNYSCSSLGPRGYSCSAAPIRCKITGKMLYTVNSGGVLISQECK